MTPYLKIDHVDKSFHRGSRETEVLKDITLSIESGEYVSIIGHSGCGKSTLLNLVACLLPVTRGAVLLSDRIVMMTNGPAAHIGEVLEVSLARPRRRLELAANATYLKCRQRVLEFLYERHSFVEAA